MIAALVLGILSVVFFNHVLCLLVAGDCRAYFRDFGNCLCSPREEKGRNLERSGSCWFSDWYYRLSFEFKLVDAFHYFISTRGCGLKIKNKRLVSDCYSIFEDFSLKRRF